MGPSGRAAHGRIPAMIKSVRGTVRLLISGVALLWWTTAASGQVVTVVHNVNLRPDPSREYPSIRVLTPAEPPLSLLESSPESGYYHVRTSAGEEGYVWGGYVQVSVAPAAPTAPLPTGPGVPGSTSMVGCGDSLWQHVYHPSRLLVQQDCVTVTGVIVDATAGQAHHQPDGVRHEADGDTHGWLQVDSQFVDLINAGNRSDEGGNLVFEIVCHYTVTQSDAQPACAGFTDHTPIPPPGTHVAITGTLVQEKNHKQWNEIHPVSRIEAR
ncbi:MAG: hypothetical protein DMD45_07700 [Gemmatimonadetes bacterium]|nr:MAG: hypothetical protein DMD45_07700 [Gemmatimonadota bacterium]